MLEAPAAPDKVVIVLSAELSLGRAANVAACLAAGLAAVLPGWGGHSLRDADGVASVASSHLPIIVLGADATRMAALCGRLGQEPPPGCKLCLFPSYAQDIHDASVYWVRHGQTSHRSEGMLGLGLAGSKKWVNGLTGSLPMLR